MSRLDDNFDVPQRPPKTNYADEYDKANWDKAEDKPASDVTEPIEDLPF